MLRQLRPGETQAEVNRRQATLLLVAGADGGPFLVGEQGNVDGPRPVPPGELPLDCGRQPVDPTAIGVL